MTVENFSEHRANPDRSQQVIELLSELSQRLRSAEGERDQMRHEMMQMRETIEGLDDRNGQMQRMHLALENKFDSTDTTVETVVRRLTGLEESVDRQSTEMLAILRKIEERFGMYDLEYKQHASSISHYAEQLERFDKRMEKLAQDKSRLGRKLDAVEFQLMEFGDRTKEFSRETGVPSAAPYRPSFSMHEDEDSLMHKDVDEKSKSVSSNNAETTKIKAEDDRSSLQIWTPETARPQFMSGPADVPAPMSRFAFLRLKPKDWTRLGQGVAVAALVVLLAGLGYGIVSTVIKHPAATGPGDIQSIALKNESQLAPLAFQKNTAGSLPVDRDGSAPSNSVMTIPTSDFFSKTVRTQMDQQMVIARKLEDEDTARLVAMREAGTLTKRLQRDSSLSRAVQAIEQKAAEGSPEAQHDMGALYTSGQSGVDVDYTRAAFWFREAANNGIPNARYNLGVLYQQGLGVEKDIDQAISWYRAAALLGHPEARYNLGIAYVEGIGASYNPAMAAGYFEQAARSGVIEAAYNLGLILENGLIDEARPYEALFWYKLASDRGSAEATKAGKRLQTDLGLKESDWILLFNKMIAERADLKALADSSLARSVTDGQDVPRVRVHTPADKDGVLVPGTSRNVARKISNTTQGPKPIDAKTDDRSMSSGPTRLVPPPAPEKIVVPAQPSSAALSGHLTDTQTVARIQAMLADEGLFAVAPTGQMGPITADAIRRYQTKYGMTVDGKASQGLLAQMLARRLAIAAEPASGDGAALVATPEGTNPKQESDKKAIEDKVAKPFSLKIND